MINRSENSKIQHLIFRYYFYTQILEILGSFYDMIFDSIKISHLAGSLFFANRTLLPLHLLKTNLKVRLHLQQKKHMTQIGQN